MCPVKDCYFAVAGLERKCAGIAELRGRRAEICVDREGVAGTPLLIRPFTWP